jgi:predicted nucleic acid-binding protein
MTFADTSFWVALLNRRDDRHAEARALWGEHAEAGVMTSDHVRGETWTVLRRRAGHRLASRFLDALAGGPRVETVHVGASLEEEALLWLRRHDERAYSFVDATSFALMRAHAAREALAFDGDFTAAGFVELRPATRS